jgi:hypothetical protein
MAGNSGERSELSDAGDARNDNSNITTGSRPVAGGAMSPAFGRTSADLATDQPAGHAEVDVRGDDSPLPGSDDVTGGWVPNIDTSAGGDIRRGRPRELHPEVDPDTRLGLHPTVRSEDLPDGPKGRTV